MNIKGGALEFEIIANNGQINSALAETKRRVQGFTNATVEGGERMEAAYKEAAAQIEAAFKDIDTMAAIHSNAISDLEKEYTRLGEAAGAAFMKGTAQGDEEFRALTAKQQAVKAEIAQRKELLQEVGNTADALRKEEQTLEENRAKVEQNTKAKGMLRTQVMNLKNSLAEMEQAGKRDTEEYRVMRAELGRLADAMADANTQAKIMSDDYQSMNAVLEVMGGIIGAFSAAQGAVGLFAGENENLQKIMVKVQSLMAITIGLQQVSKTLNKDSYTQIVLVRKAKELLTVAETKFATALGISNVAAKALMATLTLGLSVAVTFAISLISKFISKNREAKKAQGEFNNKVVDAAAKPVTAITELPNAWNRLGNDMAAKNKFLEDNKKRFEDLGFSIKTVKDAEDLLVANKSKFIEACLQRAKALAVQELAVEKYKEVLKAQQELEATPKAYVSKKGSYTDGYGVKREGVVLDKSSDWKRAEAAAAKAEREYNNLISQQVEFTAKEREILASIGVGSEKVVEGSIAALEDSISKLRAKYKEAATDTERADLLAKIKEQEALLKKVDLSATNSKAKKDPFSEQLEARKKKYTEYYKWVNSKDEIVRNAAKTEFAALLEEGSSYIDYLKKQRDQLIKAIGSGTASKKQATELQKLNNAIADETKETVLNEFEKGLQKQLSGARSIMEMLNILEEKRKELAGDGTVLDNGKKAILDDAQEGVNKQAKEQTDALIKQYSDYYGRRLNQSVEFESKMSLLRMRAKSAETQEERDRLNSIADLYTQLYDLQIDSVEELDQINADSIYRLGTFEQKRLQITKEYEKLIGAARLAGQEDVARKLEGERDLEILKETQQYKEFFGDVSEISIKTLENTRRTLIAMMKSAYEQGKLTADQYKQLLNEINKQADSAYSGRGWEALAGNSKGGGIMNLLFGEGDFTSKIDSFKNIFSGAKGDMANMASSSGEVAGNMGDAAGKAQGAVGGAAGTLSIVDAIIKGVYQTLRAVSDTLNVIADYQDSIGNSDSADTLGDWADCINAVNETAMSGWENLKSGNVMGAISDTIAMPFKLLTTLNRIHDKHIDKSIKKHAEAVRDLSNAYKQLEWQIDKALGETVYKSQKSAINNMREQQARLLEMARLEESKKKTDHDKVAQYREQYDELGRSIKDVIDEITESITQTSAKDLAKGLADAIAEAFTQGFDSAKVSAAIEKVTSKVMQDAVKNALTKNLLEIPLANVVKQLQYDMGFDDEGGGSFDGLTPDEQQRFKDKVNSIAQGYAEALKLYEDLFKDLDTGDPTTSLAGAIKGASQESIDLLAGQTNAVRVNQVQEIEILRQQLIHLANIDGKIGTSNNLLTDIRDAVKNNSSDPLRARGITM